MTERLIDLFYLNINHWYIDGAKLINLSQWFEFITLHLDSFLISSQVTVNYWFEGNLIIISNLTALTVMSTFQPKSETTNLPDHKRSKQVNNIYFICWKFSVQKKHCNPRRRLYTYSYQLSLTNGYLINPMKMRSVQQGKT